MHGASQCQLLAILLCPDIIHHIVVGLGFVEPDASLEQCMASGKRCREPAAHAERLIRESNADMHRVVPCG